MTLYGDFVTGQTVPFQRMRQLLADSGGLQEGVVGATDFKVAQRAAGATMSVDVAAGLAWVQIDTGTRNGLAHIASDATANLAVTASHATLPRIDQLVLRYNDTAIPTGAGNTPTLEVRAGTPTAGATLDNRNGAGALPADCLRLADVLVPAASSSVVTGNIRDRRPWARGISWDVVFTGGNVAIGSTFADITAVGARLECSGATLTLDYVSTMQASGLMTASLQLLQDGAVVTGSRRDQTLAAVDYTATPFMRWKVTPAPGSHVFQVQASNDSGGASTLTFNGNTTRGATFGVSERVAQNTNNN